MYHVESLKVAYQLIAILIMIQQDLISLPLLMRMTMVSMVVSCCILSLADLPGPKEVVLYQYDLADPMNPLGLLVAYAEAHVLPVAGMEELG